MGCAVASFVQLVIRPVVSRTAGALPLGGCRGWMVGELRWIGLGPKGIVIPCRYHALHVSRHFIPPRVLLMGCAVASFVQLVIRPVVS